MAIGREQTKHLYRKRASSYDMFMWLYLLAGFRLGRYRRLAIEALNLKPGDTVVDLGCGTGLNFPLLQRAVGRQGRIIGVDLTDAMLEQARYRIRGGGWENVELIQSDMAEYTFPDKVDAILSTLAITIVPAHDTIVFRGAAALTSGGRMALVELKKPENWPQWLIRFGVWINKPFGVSLDQADRHPWESIRRYLKEICYQEFYFGAVYLSVGENSNQPDIVTMGLSGKRDNRRIGKGNNDGYD